MGGLYIVSQILLIHFASASYMFLATAFLLPLQNVVLSWRLVMGAHTGTVSAATFVVSLPLSLLGCCKMTGFLRCRIFNESFLP